LFVMINYIIVISILFSFSDVVHRFLLSFPTRRSSDLALMPVVTIMLTLIAGILTGTFVIEEIFAIPGMGQYFVESINQRDYPVIMATTVFYSALLIFMLFLVDIVYGILDPRIKLHRKEGS